MFKKILKVLVVIFFVGIQYVIASAVAFVDACGFEGTGCTGRPGAITLFVTLSFLVGDILIVTNMFLKKPTIFLAILGFLLVVLPFIWYLLSLINR